MHSNLIGVLRTCLTLALVLNPAMGIDAIAFPNELEIFAKKLGCVPRREAPFKWGVIKGIDPHNSAVLWCATPKEEKLGSLASFTLYVRPGSRAQRPCPSAIPLQYVFTHISVWEPGVAGKKTTTLDSFHYVDDGKIGSKTEKVNGFVIEASLGDQTTGILYYCDRGRWMARSYD